MKTRVLHPTKGWRSISVKRSRADAITAERKKDLGGYWTHDRILYALQNGL